MTKKIQPLACAALLVLLLAPLSAPVQATPPTQAPVNGTAFDGLFARYGQEIPADLKMHNVPGLAIAVVDNEGLLWSAGFGYTDWNSFTPITADTLFSIQSLSMSFTATAALFAAQDGLVDLDAPISAYLPEFHINSIFEKHPEQKITLRMLLSHTAGLASEAPVGNDLDLPGHTFEEHIASISDTWLRFPAGTRYEYSNLGIDLAGYVLQVRAEMPFSQYVKEKLLAPLGMSSSTLDVSQVRATPGRAIGRSAAPVPPPAEFSNLPSGGVWSTANDMARFLRFHINGGELDGARLLRQDLDETMYTPPNQAASQAYYGLGILVDTLSGPRIIQASGGSFGFGSTMVWYPELKLGAVVLTNCDYSDFHWLLNKQVLTSVIVSAFNNFYDTLPNFSGSVKPAYGPITNGPAPLDTIAVNKLIAARSVPLSEDAKKRRQAYVGDYVVTLWGLPADIYQIRETDGTLTGKLSYVTSAPNGTFALSQPSVLTEVQPGLFFDQYGNVFDGRGAVLTGSNIPLLKKDRQMRRVLLVGYGVCGLIFLSTLFFWPAYALLRRIFHAFRRLRESEKTPSGDRSPTASGSAGGPGQLQGGRVWLVIAALTAVMASLVSLFCLGMVTTIPDLIYLPWPRPWSGLPWWQYAALSLPFASLLLAAVTVAAVAFAARSAYAAHMPGRQRPLRIYYSLVTLALIAFNLVLILPIRRLP